jgi:hypothetical protein
MSGRWSRKNEHVRKRRSNQGRIITIELEKPTPMKKVPKIGTIQWT